MQRIKNVSGTFLAKRRGFLTHFLIAPHEQEIMPAHTVAIPFLKDAWRGSAHGRVVRSFSHHETHSANDRGNRRKAQPFS